MKHDVAEFRTWGDGATDNRAHVILDLSYAEGWLACQPCDALVLQGEYLTLDRAWTAHRGLQYRLPQYGELAQDDEVADFLRRVAEPGYTSPMAGSYSVTNPAADLDDAFELLDRLMEERRAYQEG